MEKTAKQCGADQSTPSVPQYFSWINSTNEGSTEAQTLTNLEYFRYMRDTYGMQIKLYAWDAGNFDGARLGYGDVNSEKFKSQYPHGFGPVADRARALGIRMGLWGSPDGYGDDPETEKKRYDFMVGLCRDHGFGQFKLDGVCGSLREEKAGLFAGMLQECRKYVPELIVLNHRLPMYEAEPYVTTFLWNGREAYTDVLICNENTAMHNRAYTFTRGHVPGLNRLSEDHGVCLSSCLDYFEDELIYQAFSRCLILAPETYGNPWFLRDSEQPRLARIYNLHARNADILVHGMLLDGKFGANAVSRGIGNKRFICTGNNTWDTMTVRIPVDETVGITEPGEYRIIMRHPYDELLADVPFGESVDVPVMPFRALLLEVARIDVASPVLPGMSYEVIKEDGQGNPLEYRVLKNGTADRREPAPQFLAKFNKTVNLPNDSEYLYEKAMFSINNDALETRCVSRAGATAVPEIQAAREAFFDQRTYRLRGCENAAMFDGNDDTFFDAQSRSYCDMNCRVGNGCLRVDFGDVYAADALEIVAFVPDEPSRETPTQFYPGACDYSADLRSWRVSTPLSLATVCDWTQDVVRFTVHNIEPVKGKKVRFSYGLRGEAVRYIRLPAPMDRIFSVQLVKDGKAIRPAAPFANNLQLPYREFQPDFAKTATFTLPPYGEGDYLAVAVNGFHGDEGYSCTLTWDEGAVGADRRAPEYKANMWEHRVVCVGANNTSFITLPQGLAGKQVTVTLLFNNRKALSTYCRVYLCSFHA